MPDLFCTCVKAVAGRTAISSLRGAPPPASACHVEGGECGHVHEVSVARTERSDLHGLRKAHEHGADYGAAAKFLQHLGRDTGRMDGGHDENVGRVRQSAEWIERHGA